MAPELFILLTCHNRKEKTLACLAALFEARNPALEQPGVILVDDGSTDGTTDAVLARFPSVEVIRGDGNLFWSGGMRRAISQAELRDAQAVLWLNDDTVLFPGVIQRLCEIRETETRAGRDPILVGCTCDTGGKRTTYGGVRQGRGPLRLRFRLLPTPEAAPIPCDTFNGNCVLVSMANLRRLGGIRQPFRHALGDFDFGLRAKKLGIPRLVVPGWVGTCDENKSSGGFLERRACLKDRWMRTISPKGLPPREWWHFVTAHAGPWSPIAFLWPYFRIIFIDTLLGYLAGRNHRFQKN